MILHYLKSIQKIPIPLEEAWDFFSDPDELSVITPASMGFKIISPLPSTIEEGQRFEYRVKPLFGIEVKWVTAIREVIKLQFFADEQHKGPYKSWRHEHRFEQINGGVEMRDLVKYEMPLGILGSIAHVLFVRRKLRKIFEFRYRKVQELFGQWPDGEEMKVEIT